MTAPDPLHHDVPPAGSETSDLGFGRVVAQAVRGRFLNRDGKPNSRRYGLGPQRAARFYLAALDATWPAFTVWTAGLILLLNGIFAVAYLALGPSALAGTEQMGPDDPFLRAFAFSVGIFTTTGGGTMHAVGSTANWLVNLESFVGPTALVVAFGLVITRLTRPPLRLGFSDSAVVASYDGGRGLMFRIVNLLPAELSDVQARVNLVRFEEVDGVRERTFHELALERSAVELFTLHWTIVHPITADSPLAGMTPESLADSQAEFLVFISAHEHTFSTRVTTRSSYLWDEVRWDVRFASMFSSAPHGIMAIDIERLSRTEPLPEGATRQPAPGEEGQPASS